MSIIVRLVTVFLPRALAVRLDRLALRVGDGQRGRHCLAAGNARIACPATGRRH